MSQTTTQTTADPAPGASAAEPSGLSSVDESLPAGRPHAKARLDSVDIVRGLVMVVMALDHTRDFLHVYAKTFDPLDLSQTWAGLYFTRWVTHFCAPAFVFLAGTGAFLSGSRGRTKPELARFLLTRGLWLVLLELTLVRFGLFFNFDYHLVFLQVIWAIGWSMVALAGLVFLPLRAVAVVGLLLIFAHNAFDPVRSGSLGSLGWLWVLLHEQNVITPREGFAIFVAYPLVPWVGVMAAGYACGGLLTLGRERRRRLLFRIGGAAVALFVALRWLNVYGDPRPWQAQESAWLTLLSFLNTAKYPPSLLFLLMTLGPTLVAVALFDRGPGREPGRLARPFVVFGRVPLFYYLLHFPLIHLVAVLFALVKYGRAEWLFLNFPPPGAPPVEPPGYGYDLLVVYAVWLGVVVALYPVCRWFAAVKARRRDAWLSYL